jgi:hypothetical protein
MMEAVVYHGWTASRHYVSAIHPTNTSHALLFTNPSDRPIGYWTGLESEGGPVRGFHHGFCRVRVSIIGLRLLYGARFSTGFALEDAIVVLTFAPLEVLPCE